jgi:hypothetical protein
MVQHIRHLGPKGVNHESPERVGVVKLHDAPSLPAAVRRWPGVAVHDDHRTPRRANAMAVNRPVGPAPTITVCTSAPN